MRFLISVLTVTFLLVGCGESETAKPAQTAEQPSVEQPSAQPTKTPAQTEKPTQQTDSHSSSENSKNSSFDPSTGFVVLATPVKTTTKDKIEVVEVFWYGCGHCYTFESLLKPWKKTLPADVELVKNPAIWHDNMEPHARIYYAAKALGIEDVISPKAFAVLNKTPRKKLTDEDKIAELFTSSGVSKEDFSKAFNSFGVKSQAQQANSKARAYQVTGTPEMIVDGRYRISTRMAETQENMLKTVNYLIKKVRAEKAPAK